MESQAWFSPCRKYRYGLARIWDDKIPILPFCMLNPSTASEVVNDPTITRCMNRAQKMGFGGILVVNVFAYRSTDPEELYEVEDPIGPDNDKHLLYAAKFGTIVCGWGKHGSLYDRGNYVVSLIRGAGCQPLALKINKDGSPAHPLYIKYDQKPVDLWTGEPFLEK